MKARLFTLMTVLCIMLSLLPVSADEAKDAAAITAEDLTPVITITKQPENSTTVYTKSNIVEAGLNVEASLS